jgi:hypothetical protein
VGQEVEGGERGRVRVRVRAMHEHRRQQNDRCSGLRCGSAIDGVGALGAVLSR